MRKFSLSIMCLSVVTLLSGCLYPEDQLTQNRPPKEAVRNVQAAVDEYYTDTGLLPLHNSQGDVPKYEKFKVDFKNLQVSGYISAIPTAAFENGGNYYFLILDEETDPTVKLMDIAHFQQMNALQTKVTDAYRNSGELPAGDSLYNGFYAIDYNKIGMKAPVLRSMFSGQTLWAIIDENGTVYTDYALDIMHLLQNNTELVEEYSETDLRQLLVDHSDYVPVKSPEYMLNNGEPEAILP